MVQGQLNDNDGQRHQKYNGVLVSLLLRRRGGAAETATVSKNDLMLQKRCSEKIHLSSSEKFLPKFYLDVLQNILGCVKADGIDKPKRLVLRK